MLLEITDWVKVLSILAAETGRTKKAILEDAGIAGNAACAYSNSTTPPEPKHSEGDFLLKMFRKVTGKRFAPKLKKSASVRCPSCSILKPRAEIMRMGVQKFRCTTCSDRAKGPKRF